MTYNLRERVPCDYGAFHEGWDIHDDDMTGQMPF